MPTAPKADTARRGADRTAIIAGGGALPIDLAHGLVERGETPFVLIVRGEVENPAAFADVPTQLVEIEEFGRLIGILKKQSVTRVVLAGTIKRRPRAMDMSPKLPFLRALPRFIAALARGDDSLLRTVIGFIEDQGIKVVGAHEILPDLLVQEGVHSKRKPTKQDRLDIDAALIAAQTIGGLDIGQAAVAIGGRVIALEGIEGTDGLLDRVAGLRGHGRLAGRKGGVLVKCAKPAQELRADLPGIGVQTVEGAHRAGLAGIAVEAERSIGLGFADLIKRADALGLFVIGLPREKSP